MDNMQTWISQYEDSADRLRREIAACSPPSPEEEGDQDKRRMMLYHMLWDVEASIARLKEYPPDGANPRETAWLADILDVGVAIGRPVKPSDSVGTAVGVGRVFCGERPAFSDTL
jgi:hypothetical protein